MGDLCRSPVNIDDALASRPRAIKGVRAAAGSRTKLSGATDRAGRLSRQRGFLLLGGIAPRRGDFPFCFPVRREHGPVTAHTLRLILNFGLS